MKKNFVFLVFLIFPYLLFSQAAPIRFGKVSKQELEMKVYEKDTSAAAVVLCDYGVINSELHFVRILRIKILKQAGLSYANNIYPTVFKSMIKGVTFNLEGDKIVKTKLSNESIFVEKVYESRYRTRVAMPNVKVGSIIDIQFSGDGFPSEWAFQESIPVVWSELVFENNNYFNIRKNFYGYESLYINEGFRWAAKDMPAFKEEPFISSPENYINKIEFDIIPTSIDFTWDYICTVLLNYERFGDIIKMSSYLSPLAEELKAKYSSDEDLIDAAFQSIKVIRWNGQDDVIASEQYLSRIYKERLGNSADINLALYQLLEKLGYKVTPVVLSTKEEGMLPPLNPTLSKLNHVVVQLELEDKTLLLDASEEYAPYYLLPEKSLNGRGRLVSVENGGWVENSGWVELKPAGKEKEIIVSNLKLTDQLDVEGSLNYILYDYAALNFRKKYFTFNSEDEFIQDFTQNNPGIYIDNASFSNLDTLKYPVQINYDLEFQNQVMGIGDEYYLFPLFNEQLKENPLKAESRRYPVDFIYQKEKLITANIIIPEDFEVVSMPKPMKMVMSNNAGSFLYLPKYSENIINVKVRFTIDKETFLPSEYSELKEFYNQIIKKYAEPIILKKKL